VTERIVHTLKSIPGHEHFTHAIFCPACKTGHGLCVGNSKPPNWTFNGDFDKPTFTPSLLITGVQNATEEEWERIERGEKVERRPLVCHSFITDGKIEFLDDCTHELRGKTVPLEPF
jgi:Family of unknown function (DUF6527)